jgi:hypothetical protein
MLVRASSASDRDAIDAFLDEHSSQHVARLGELVVARERPALLAQDDKGVSSDC